MPKRFLNSRVYFAFIACCLLLLSSCHGDFTPKQKAYPRVIFPEHKFELYDPATCPFKFEKPVYAQVEVDSVYMGHKLFQPCWLNIVFPGFNGTINLTYKEIGDTLKFDKLIEDAHSLSYKHTKKADYINEIHLQNAHGVGGLLYDVGGDAASNVQFFLTDTTKHFIRGALYFNNEPNTDSMAPVISFVKDDMRHILQTFQWK
jgi:gliding motility-associated lipoprotein GldD